jgi:cobalt-zinc-cadmium efflux system outer membrane protein
MHGGLSMMFVTRLKIAATVVAAFGLAMAGAAALATRPVDRAFFQEPPPAGASGPATSTTSARAVTQSKMTLEEAIERTVRENAEPLARRMGIAAGEIERLLARLRSDRSNDAAGPRRLVEAQFQDAMRNQIDAVYKSFVDVEAAQERLRLASATLERWERILGVTRTPVEQGARPAADVERIRAARDLARSKRDDATTSLTRARAGLCSQLNLPVVGRERLEVASRISQLRAAVLPEVDELVPLALAIRPDLAGYRLGKKRAEADVATAQANRISDTYLLYSPYTFAGVSGLGVQSATWAVGVRLPIYESAQGRMARAKLNLDQTQIQIASMERQVSEEVAGAHLTCELCESELSRSETGALVEAARRRESAEREYLEPARAGGLPVSRTLESLLSGWRECEKAESRHVEILVRYLRNSLELNTAVGERIMP